ncbi:MAG: hypothetical protein ACMVY4_03280 [Minwuia sp.]|uniref:hypothetical protein n=1 Tax=Minwuia sp. TaxID=2493630 RepID=UPI003A83AC8D
MYDLSFRSDDPLDHLPRALDQLRRASFTLHRAAVETGDGDTAWIRVRITEPADGAAETFRCRVGNMVGISDLDLTLANC